MSKRKNNLIIAVVIFIAGFLIADNGDFGFGDIHVIRALGIFLFSIIVSVFFIIRAFLK